MDDPATGCRALRIRRKATRSPPLVWLLQRRASRKYIVALQGAGESTGNRVYVDDKLIIDNWKLVRAMQRLKLRSRLGAGLKQIVVEDFRQLPPSVAALRFAIVDAPAHGRARHKELSAPADVVLVSAGFDADSESEGGDRTFALSLRPLNSSTMSLPPTRRP